MLTIIDHNSYVFKITTRDLGTTRRDQIWLKQPLSSNPVIKAKVPYSLRLWDNQSVNSRQELLRSIHNGYEKNIKWLERLCIDNRNNVQKYEINKNYNFSKN